MRKKMLSVLIALTMLLVLAAPVFAAKAPSTRILDTCAPYATEATYKMTELMAGQNTDVGEVRIDATAVPNQYVVTYIVDVEGWCLTEVHFEAITATDTKYIYSNGGLIPGSFTCRKSWNASENMTTFTCLYTAGATVTGFAAHAVVVHPEVGHTDTDYYDFCVTSGANIDLASGESAAIAWGANDPWGTVDDLVNAIPECLDPAGYIWDAQWVTPEVADNGGMVDFVQSFDIIGTPVSATFKIAADNAFAYQFNTAVEVSRNLSADWRTQAALGNFDTPPYAVDPVVVLDPNPSGWSMVYSEDVLGSLVSGANVLSVTGVNADWSTTDPMTNPAMVIYKLCGTSKVDTYVVDEPYAKESAWGAGGAVDGGNWSMIIANPYPLTYYWGPGRPYGATDEVFAIAIVTYSGMEVWWYSDGTLLKPIGWWHDTYSVTEVYGYTPGQISTWNQPVQDLFGLRFPGITQAWYTRTPVAVTAVPVPGVTSILIG